MRSAAPGIPIGLAALAFLMAAPVMAQAGPSAPSPQALSEAIRVHGSGEIAVEDIRAVACESVSHAPGALDCRWEQRTGGDWHLYTSWLAMVGTQWTMLDAPIAVPDFERGRLKPFAPVAAP